VNWPLCECECGQPVAADVRSGRPTRYASRRCSQLASQRAARKRPKPGKLRRCVTCLELKPWAAFDSRDAKRCKTCKHRVAVQTCAICGDPAGEAVRGHPRKFCTKPECRTAWFSKTRKIAVAKQAKKLAARKTKRCPTCDRKKPLTDEFWSVSGVKFDGSVRWDSYCKVCRAAIARDRHRNDPQKREQRRLSHRRYREKIRAMRDADPVFDQQMRDLHREQNRRSRERKAERVTEQPRSPYPGGMEIPAWPLAAFIDEQVNKHRRRLNGSAPDRDESVEAMCMKLGIDSRRVREWRGGQSVVRLDVVDRVCTNAGVLWFDVFDQERFPAEHERAALAFTG
jgi:hypothetical protein